MFLVGKLNNDVAMTLSEGVKRVRIRKDQLQGESAQL